MRRLQLRLHRGRNNPPRFIVGIVSRPVVTTFEITLPEREPKNPLASTATLAGPPRLRPKMAAAKFMKNAPPPVTTKAAPKIKKPIRMLPQRASAGRQCSQTHGIGAHQFRWCFAYTPKETGRLLRPEREGEEDHANGKKRDAPARRTPSRARRQSAAAISVGFSGATVSHPRSMISPP